MSAGMRFDNLKKLELSQHHFRYGRTEYAYADVEHIRAFSTSKPHHLKGKLDGISYHAFLEVTVNGKKLQIAQKRTWWGYPKKEFSDAVMKAATELGRMTFFGRMARYEKQLATRGYVEWGPYHLFANGDLRKHWRLRFNLWGAGVSLRMPNPLTVKAVGHPKAWWGRFFWRVDEIDIATDRDCFLYLMKYTYGFTWANEPVYDKPGASPQAAAQTKTASQAHAAGGDAGARQEPHKPPPPPKLAEPDDLAILGLAAGAEWAEIRRAYLKMVMRHHPDRLQAQGVSEQEMARSEDILKTVNVAYARLEVKFAPRSH